MHMLQKKKKKKKKKKLTWHSAQGWDRRCSACCLLVYYYSDIAFCDTWPRTSATRGTSWRIQTCCSRRPSIVTRCVGAAATTYGDIEERCGSQTFKLDNAAISIKKNREKATRNDSSLSEALELTSVPRPTPPRCRPPGQSRPAPPCPRRCRSPPRREAP